MGEDAAALLHVYDSQLREAAEVSHCSSVERRGPLWWGVSADGGFVTSGRLSVAEAELERLVDATIAHFRDDTRVAEFEWKTRGHDPADVRPLLTARGFAAEEVETVMMGSVEHLTADVGLPDGVVVRQAGVGGDLGYDVRRAAGMQVAVFGGGPDWRSTLDHLRKGAGRVELWLAEAGDQVVSAGRIDFVEGTECAGLWGGATLADWRGRGIYRALTAARARSAASRGVRYVQSDCTAMSRPILERSGLVKVTTTTPYIWRRDG
ncbi:GNAT family N-acetyltransferase [Calidifontibacter sp. DB0510]|uniref:GNAT family N-acetyltransferase n=1 Tax=Metallococcus carri TaxID=1656884 RepID=A0A967B3B5_9MICO|nr:GNAT family N-acetyltransferase [Metallococcus carri]NHN57247.1 GNAT family N-acetyltransferase [Metallococcus carri]NOP37950.1 GNAT family N-acetyltransferase [Calidifontibacter sp. DB2511S]